LAEVREPVFRLEGWIRRHIRKCFWRRRERALRGCGLRGRMLKITCSSRGAWHLAGTGSLQTALSTVLLRRMRKTARPVVWEGDRDHSRSLDPI
jgi:RNA-directed DNA polymerase